MVQELARDDDMKDNFSPGPIRSASGKVDFAKEHKERQKYEYEYVKGKGFVPLEKADVQKYEYEYVKGKGFVRLEEMLNSNIKLMMMI